MQNLKNILQDVSWTYLNLPHEIKNSLDYFNSLLIDECKSFALLTNEQQSIIKAYKLDYTESITKLIESHEKQIPSINLQAHQLLNNNLIRLVGLLNKDKEQILQGYTLLHLPKSEELKETIFLQLQKSQNLPLGLWLFKQKFTSSDFSYKFLEDGKVLRCRSFVIDCSFLINANRSTVISSQEKMAYLYLAELINLEQFKIYTSSN